jgi:hypothetical protein
MILRTELVRNVGAHLKKRTTLVFSLACLGELHLPLCITISRLAKWNVSCVLDAFCTIGENCGKFEDQ